MPKCSFCGCKEDKQTPICQTCGSLRYPVASSRLPGTISRQSKIKLSAALAVAFFTPGSFVVLALVGASRFNTKNKKRNTYLNY